MSELLQYIGADELVFHNDATQGIHSGGFNVRSIMLKAGMSPIVTLNGEIIKKGGGELVSDLFNDLVVPNWVLSYNNRIAKGGSRSRHKNKDSDSEDDVIDDDLHDTLLALVKQDNPRKSKTRKATKTASKRVSKKRRH